ncbi:MAG: serine hydrolase domain-containing protein [Opitutaceae bacterium]|jgi:CubicO group peptidase (beta-lactamase class C family)
MKQTTSITAILWLLAGLAFFPPASARAQFVTANAVTAQSTSSKGPGQVLLPTPGSGNVLTDPAGALSWTPVSGASSYDVYFGTSSSSLKLVSSKQKGTSYKAKSALSANTTYYWRVDARNSSAASTGVVWTFTTNGPDLREALDGSFPDPTTWLIAPGNKGSATVWKYEFSNAVPDPSWNQPGYDDSAWLLGKAGFGTNPGQEPADVLNTTWPSDQADLWLRQTITLTATDIANSVPQKLALWGRWDDYFDVYINGVLAATSNPDNNRTATCWGWINVYGYYGVLLQARNAVHVGTNTIAIHGHNNGGPGYLDLGLTLNPAFNPPVSGTDADPSWKPYSDAVRNLVEENVIPAAVLGVMHNNKIVSLHGYGYLDKARTIPTPPNAVLRLASVDKMITKAAVMLLIDTNAADPITHQTLTLDTPVFPLLRAHGLTALPGMTPDSRIDLVTLNDLIQHEGGVAGLTDNNSLYVAAGKTQETYDPIDNIRYVYSSPLAFAPGTSNAYSSSGYMVLRNVVDVVTGNLQTYLQNTLIGPAGSKDVFIAHERAQMRIPNREPWYEHEQPWVYPDYWVNYDYCTALSTSPEAFVRFTRWYHFVTGELQVNPKTGVLVQPDLLYPSVNPQTWIYSGGMAGTTAYASQRNCDDTQIFVAFDLGGHFDDIIDQLGGAPIRPVPDRGATGVPTNVTLSWTPGINTPVYRIKFGAGSASNMQIVGTTTGTTYNPGVLQPNTTYFWQVDGMFPCPGYPGVQGVSVGDYASFTTAP